MSTTDDIRGLGRERQLGALVELCRELVKLGIQVGLSDARPAVSARGRLTPRTIWIEIDAPQQAFAWRHDHHERHSINDPAGAAARLAELLTPRSTRPGDRP